ncbi:MAG: AAA family ATPase [Candidatus Woesearchaeota archaeon]
MTVLIGITGLPGAGKSHFSSRLAKDLKINHVRTDGLRNFLISSIQYYHDADYSYSNPKIHSANQIVTKLANDIVSELLKQKQPVILDSCGKTKERRLFRFESAKLVSPKLKTVIIEIKTEEDSILNRLKERKVGKKWVETYLTKWKSTYEAPTNEADLILTYETESDYENILKKLKHILKIKP